MARHVGEVDWSVVTRIRTQKGIRTFTQPRAAQTYLAILEAAARIFPEHGFEATQTPDIAKEAGVSTGSIYRYFDDKRQIFLEMAEMELGKIRKDVEARLTVLTKAGLGSDPVAALERLIDTLFDQIKKDAPLARVFAAMALTDPDVAALKARTEAEDREAVARVIELSIPRAIVANPLATAMIVHAAAVGTATELALRKKRARGPTDAEAKAALHEMLSRFFFGARH